MFRDVPGCSGNVPECSGMFHVPDFIDGPTVEGYCCILLRFPLLNYCLLVYSSRSVRK